MEAAVTLVATLTLLGLVVVGVLISGFLLLFTLTLGAVLRAARRRPAPKLSVRYPSVVPPVIAPRRRREDWARAA